MQNWTFPNQKFNYPILAQQQSRHRFTKEEDEAMLVLIDKFEDKNFINWNRVASQMPNRSPRQCRERYLNYLVEKTKKGDWSKEEDDLIFSLYDQIGPKWSKMTQYFRERSNIDIKNRYSTLLRRKQNSFQSKQNNIQNFDPQLVNPCYENIVIPSNNQYNYSNLTSVDRYNNFYELNLMHMPIANSYVVPQFIY